MHFLHLTTIPDNGHRQDPPNPTPQDDVFPPVNTKKLHSSAEKMLRLTKEANLLVNKIIEAPKFANELMNAAQLSNKTKVHDLILSVGITSKINTYYTPTGIRIEFDNSDQTNSCCRLNMSLHW
ncbi:hypothetical protein [Sporosarcina sp. HYO08]|uniref:hypothetical protein n=1 Tax=Sporosarcina sp. HYO08 TaxID=1759557 RepID=UPI000792DADF|nr:hypothetical protein [Sporosarcina sp. HYO08]KXH81740.1 hypothetical protein AU377_05605 [Sporosarcina sp. HYO08]